MGLEPARGGDNRAGAGSVPDKLVRYELQRRLDTRG